MTRMNGGLRLLLIFILLWQTSTASAWACVSSSPAPRVSTIYFDEQALISPLWRFLKSFSNGSARLNQRVPAVRPTPIPSRLTFERGFSRQQFAVGAALGLLISISAGYYYARVWKPRHDSQAVSGAQRGREPSALPKPGELPPKPQHIRVEADEGIPQEKVRPFITGYFQVIDELMKNSASDSSATSESRQALLTGWQAVYAGTRVTQFPPGKAPDAFVHFRSLENRVDFDKKVGLDLTRMEPLVTRAKAGDAEARKVILDGLLSAGRLLIEFRPGDFQTFVESNVKALRDASKAGLPALASIQKAMREYGFSMMVSGSDAAAVGALSPVFINDPDKPGTVYLRPELVFDYDMWKATLRYAAESPEKRTLYSNIFLILEIKEGGGLYDVYQRLKPSLDLQNLMGEAMREIPSTLTFPDAVELAKRRPDLVVKAEKVMAGQTLMESRGYEAMLDAMAWMGIDDNVIKAIGPAEPNKALSGFLARIHKLLLSIGNHTGALRDRQIRLDVFTTETRFLHPGMTELIFAAGYLKGTMKLDANGQIGGGPDSLSFLFDKTITREDERTPFKLDGVELHDISDMLRLGWRFLAPALVLGLLSTQFFGYDAGAWVSVVSVAVLFLHQTRRSLFPFSLLRSRPSAPAAFATAA